MPYIEGRVVHDADAHVVETPDWLVRCADPSIRDRVPQLHLATTKPGEDRLIAHFTRKHRDAAYRAHDAQLEKGASRFLLLSFKNRLAALPLLVDL